MSEEPAVRPTPRRRPLPRRHAQEMQPAAIRKRAVDRDFIDALQRAQELLSEATSTLAMAASTPEQHDFVNQWHLVLSHTDRYLAKGYGIDSPF